MTALSCLLPILSFACAASATVLTLGPSTQSVTLTGLGGNTAGDGTSRVTWGACSYDGTNTSCVVSGSYTGLGSGGTYKRTLQYPGNGPSPLIWTSTSPGSDLIAGTLSAGSFTFTITPAGGASITFYDAAASFVVTSPVCTGATNGCTVGNVGLTVGATMTGPLTGSFDATPKITTPNGLISASAYGSFTAIAPATWIEIYGTNLATIPASPGYTWSGADFNGVNAPTSLQGTSVTIGGKPAFLDYVSAHQVNAQVPSGIGNGVQPVVVTTAGGASTAYSVTVNTVQPGMLAPIQFKFAAGQYVVALQPNGSTYILPPGATSAIPTAVAKPGDVITLYGIGFGPVSPNIDAGAIVGQANALTGFSATIGGQSATVQFAGLVAGFLGLYQFNLVVPQIPANNATPLTFAIGGVSSTQQLLLAVGN